MKHRSPKPRPEKFYIQYSKFLKDGLPEDQIKHTEFVSKWIKGTGFLMEECIVLSHIGGTVYGIASRATYPKIKNINPL